MNLAKVAEVELFKLMAYRSTRRSPSLLVVMALEAVRMIRPLSARISHHGRGPFYAPAYSRPDIWLQPLFAKNLTVLLLHASGVHI